MPRKAGRGSGVSVAVSEDGHGLLVEQDVVIVNGVAWAEDGAAAYRNLASGGQAGP
jgi:sugar lactone lactonase YvrE